MLITQDVNLYADNVCVYYLSLRIAVALVTPAKSFKCSVIFFFAKVDIFTVRLSLFS